MKKRLYVIQDTLAGSMVGGITMYPHDAAAIRFFSDVAQDSRTYVAQHVDDYSLLLIGEIDEEQATITPLGPDVIITGAMWKATQAKAEG